MDKHLHNSDDYKYIPATSVNSGVGVRLLPDIYCYTNQIVNIVLIGNPKEGGFVLVDTGMPYSTDKIISIIESEFGEVSKPKAIVLTHGHFDHVGAVVDLVEKWDVPVYAHALELPFLTGEESYPEPDATVEGGMVAKMSPMFPNEPIDLGSHVKTLPEDGSIPHLADFRWIHTPGHAPGHISLFREEDRTLIAGDAFVTVKQEYLYKVMTQEKEISGPPRYLTTDWELAKESVMKLDALKPKLAVTGHGVPMEGEELTRSLAYLVEEFDSIALPDTGRYLN